MHEVQEELKRPESAQAAGPEQRDPQQPGKEEEKKKHEGYLRLQTYEEPLPEVFLTAKVEDPMLKREQFALDVRKSNKQAKITKKRNQHGQFQEIEPGFPELEMLEEQGFQEGDFIYEDSQQPEEQPEAQTAAQYLSNPE